MDRDQKWYEDQFWHWMDVLTVEETFDEKWRRMSAGYIPRARMERDIKYGNGANEVFDLFIPDDGESVPVLIFVHGGYWTWMDKDTYAFSLEPIRSAGALVASVNYTLCPHNTISGIVDQVRRACIFIYENVGAYNGDQNNIHITGHSAGGHLTAMMAATDWRELNPDLPIDLLKSAIPSSGLFDMNNMRLTPQLNEHLKLDREEADANSPLFLAPAYDMPISVVVGAEETEGFLLESKNFSKAWSDRVTNLRYMEVPRVHHFSLIENMLTPGDPFTCLLLEHLGLDGP
ncbi:MAG: alpha/beta hydrolase [Pseudomonadota bacterium]